MWFSRQEYWSGLPCSPPGDLHNWRIKPGFPTLQTDRLQSEPPGKPNLSLYSSQFCKWEQMILMQVRAKNPTRQLAVTHSSNSSQFTKVTLSGKWAYCHFFPVCCRHCKNLRQYGFIEDLCGDSVGKEYACNTGDLGSVPRLGRSPGEGNSYPL